MTRRLGGKVITAQGYGMTEMSPVSHLADFAKLVPGSIGRVVANCEARIVDPKDHVDVVSARVGVGRCLHAWCD